MHGVNQPMQPNALRPKALSILRRLRLLGTSYGYKMGEMGPIGTDNGHTSGSVSWIKRAFWFDHYSYFVATYHYPDNGVPLYYIARARTSLEFYSHEEVISLPDGASGLEEDDGTYRLQKLPDEEALTKFGYWLNTPWTDQFYGLDQPAPIGPMPLPTEVLAFNTEQAAYEYMNRVSGREIPPQILHLAWFTIGLSTFLWQVTSWGPTIYNWVAAWL